jgi:hypothetical protein
MFFTARVMVLSAAKAEEEASKPIPRAVIEKSLIMGVLHL